MDVIYTDVNRKEIGFLADNVNIDFETGLYDTSDNDFELTFNSYELPSELRKGSLIYEINSEFGGVVTGIGVDTSINKAYIYGRNWRQLIKNYIVEPPKGKAYYIANGDANVVLADLLKDKFDGLIRVKSDNANISVYAELRYNNLLECIESMLSKANAKLKLTNKRDTDFYIEVEAVPIEDLSNDIQLDNDYGRTLIAKKNEDGITHVICLGQGELTERTVIHLYKSKIDGTVTQDSSKKITGLEERTITYDYSSAETTDELIEGGIKLFSENGNTETLSISVQYDVDIGDIVGAKEQLTNIEMSKRVVQKVYKGYPNNIDVSFKVGEE